MLAMVASRVASSSRTGEITTILGVAEGAVSEAGCASEVIGSGKLADIGSCCSKPMPR
jgi:hypothetical protein